MTFSGHRQGAASEAVAAVAFEVEGFGDGVSGSWLAGMCSLYRLEHPLIGFQTTSPTLLNKFLIYVTLWGVLALYIYIIYINMQGMAFKVVWHSRLQLKMTRPLCFDA
jgi:hypothetical protein